MRPAAKAAPVANTRRLSTGLLLAIAAMIPPGAVCYNRQRMFKGLEHTAIASPDPEKLARWYVDHLEFRINFTYDGNYFVKAPDGTMLEIIPSEGDRLPQKMKDPGIRHLAIAVDDFDAAHRRLREQGVRFAGEPFNNKGNRLVFFTDLDGNLVHLIHRENPLP
jgi:glyoxylase I family protein